MWPTGRQMSAIWSHTRFNLRIRASSRKFRIISNVRNFSSCWYPCTDTFSDGSAYYSTQAVGYHHLLIPEIPISMLSPESQYNISNWRRCCCPSTIRPEWETYEWPRHQVSCCQWSVACFRICTRSREHHDIWTCDYLCWSRSGPCNWVYSRQCADSASKSLFLEPISQSW